MSLGKRFQAYLNRLYWGSVKETEEYEKKKEEKKDKDKDKDRTLKRSILTLLIVISMLVVVYVLKQESAEKQYIIELNQIESVKNLEMFINENLEIFLLAIIAIIAAKYTYFRSEHQGWICTIVFVLALMYGGMFLKNTLAVLVILFLYKAVWRPPLHMELPLLRQNYLFVLISVMIVSALIVVAKCFNSLIGIVALLMVILLYVLIEFKEVLSMEIAERDKVLSYIKSQSFRIGTIHEVRAKRLVEQLFSKRRLDINQGIELLTGKLPEQVREFLEQQLAASSTKLRQDRKDILQERNLTNYSISLFFLISAIAIQLWVTNDLAVFGFILLIVTVLLFVVLVSGIVKSKYKLWSYFIVGLSGLVLWGIASVNDFSSFLKNSLDLSQLSLVIILYVLACLVIRSYEICLSFLRDVFGNQVKSSSLNRKERIKLAITSLVEVIFLSATIYMLLPNVETNFATTISTPQHISETKTVSIKGMPNADQETTTSEREMTTWQTENQKGVKTKETTKQFIETSNSVETIQSGDEDTSLATSLDTLLYSTAVSFFNYSYPENLGDDNKLLLLQLTHLCQIAVSLSLLTFAISKYMGTEDAPFEWEISQEGGVYKIKRVYHSSAEKNQICELPSLAEEIVAEGAISSLEQQIKENQSLSPQEKLTIFTYLHPYLEIDCVLRQVTKSDEQTEKSPLPTPAVTMPSPNVPEDSSVIEHVDVVANEEDKSEQAVQDAVELMVSTIEHFCQIVSERQDVQFDSHPYKTIVADGDKMIGEWRSEMQAMHSGVATLQQITKQSRMLSLNAGDVFTVIAKEVAELAERSKQALVEIEKGVTAVQGIVTNFQTNLQQYDDAVQAESGRFTAELEHNRVSVELVKMEKKVELTIKQLEEINASPELVKRVKMVRQLLTERIDATK